MSTSADAPPALVSLTSNWSCPLSCSALHLVIVEFANAFAIAAFTGAGQSVSANAGDVSETASARTSVFMTRSIRSLRAAEAPSPHPARHGLAIDSEHERGVADVAADR